MTKAKEGTIRMVAYQRISKEIYLVPSEMMYKDMVDAYVQGDDDTMAAVMNEIDDVLDAEDCEDFDMVIMKDGVWRSLVAIDVKTGEITFAPQRPRRSKSS